MREFILSENKENINFKGRSAFVNDWLCLDFTASGFEFSADFESSNVVIKANIFTDYGLIGIVIDNDYENMVHIPVVGGNQNITVAENLNGKHTLKIVKLLEYSKGRYEIKSISFDGEFIQKPKEKALKFEFYGDSLTCGYGNLCSTRETPNPFGYLEHGYKTWCVLLCEKLGAEMSAVSSSGQGIVTDCRGNSEGTIKKYWNMAVPSLKIKWDFNYKPDYVFINLCANDVNYLRFIEGASMDWGVFKAKAKELIDGIRKNAPDCKIIFPLGFDCGNEHFDNAVKAYREMIEEYGYKDVVIYDDISCNQLGGDWHPNLNDDKMMFETLYNHLKEDFGL